MCVTENRHHVAIIKFSILDLLDNNIYKAICNSKSVLILNERNLVDNKQF